MIYQGLEEIKQKTLLNGFSRRTPPCATSEEPDGEQVKSQLSNSFQGANVIHMRL